MWQLSEGVKNIRGKAIIYERSLLIAFLNDPYKMREENYASNYDIFTGKSINPQSRIDEIHTGSLWEPARQKYCGDDAYALGLGVL